MNKASLVKKLLPQTYQKNNQNLGKAFAPSNIALCKYWGKRDEHLNLPATSSLSISLGSKGSHCAIRECGEKEVVTVNQQRLPDGHEFSSKLSSYLDLFRPSPNSYYAIDFDFNIPVSAGVASSACSFASLIMALDDLYQWHLEKSSLSILSRLGSGSACRSLWQGFVKWQQGVLEDGMDSHGYPLHQKWENLCVGLCIFSSAKKPLSSREAMIRTADTSVFYKVWPQQVIKDLRLIEEAIERQDFEQLGSISEANAMALHALMMNSFPPILYSLPETIEAIHRAFDLRKAGHAVYFTQDAGANLKLLFLEQDEAAVQAYFPQMEVIKPFMLATLDVK